VEYFREVQPLRRNPVVWFVAALTALAILLTLATRAAEPGWAVAFPLLTIVWLLLVKLETEVREDGVRLRFHLLWFPKTIPWDRIESAEAVVYRPLVQYGGWGIRRGWGGEWAWNVSGSEGVRLRLRDGKSFLIGSARAERLAGAIRDRLRAGGRL
jgi:hypothetical protein